MRSEKDTLVEMLVDYTFKLAAYKTICEGFLNDRVRADGEKVSPKEVINAIREASEKIKQEMITKRSLRRASRELILRHLKKRMEEE